MDWIRTEADARTKVAKFLCTDYEDQCSEIQPLRDTLDYDDVSEDEEEEEEEKEVNPQNVAVSVSEHVRLEEKQGKSTGIVEEEYGDGPFGDVPSISLDSFLATKDLQNDAKHPRSLSETRRAQTMHGSNSRMEDEDEARSMFSHDKEGYASQEGILSDVRRSSTIYRDPNLPGGIKEGASVNGVTARIAAATVSNALSVGSLCPRDCLLLTFTH